jgi:hypothetical protein
LGAHLIRARLPLGKPAPSPVRDDLGRWHCTEESGGDVCCRQGGSKTPAGTDCWVSVWECAYVYICIVCICMYLYVSVEIWYKYIVFIKYVQPQWVSETYCQSCTCRRVFQSRKVNDGFVEKSMCFWSWIQCTGCQHLEKAHLFAITFPRNTYIHTYKYWHVHTHTFTYMLTLYDKYIIHTYAYVCHGICMHLYVLYALYVLYVYACICMCCTAKNI